MAGLFKPINEKPTNKNILIWPTILYVHSIERRFPRESFLQIVIITKVLHTI